jgi:cytidylate kinase
MAVARGPVVAIDGPAGAGKSTVARRVARELGYLLLDTGALYRSVALAASRAGMSEPRDIARVAFELAAAGRVRFLGSVDEQQVLLDDEDVSLAIRTPEMGTLASKASAIPEVREALLELQRGAGREGSVVVEGRDIGSVVFPESPAKFFLTASVQARAGRRFEELRQKQHDVTLGGVEAEVRERDRRDSNRPVAPLTQAPDAVLLDSTGLSVDEVVRQIVERVRAVERELARGAEGG